MISINLYLTFDGNCLEAFKFYKSVFGGEFASISRFSEMPPDPNYEVPESDKDKVMHVSLPAGKDSVLMGSDKASGYGPDLVAGNNFSISVNADNRQEADRIFMGLSSGGRITMPMADTFWGSYFGMCVDKFGINWMVNCEIPK